MANSIPKIIYNNGVTDVTIQFDYPPRGMDFEGKTYKFVQKVSEANNGGYQTSDNYTEDERNLEFRQVSATILAELQTFYLTHAGKGKPFDYYIHSDEVTFDTLKLSKRSRRFKPQRTGWNSAGLFTYKFKIKMRQAL